MKFACLHHGDQHAEGLWSGIPLNIMRALSALGHEVVAVDRLQPQVPLIGRVKTAFYRYLLKKEYAINRDPLVFRLRAKEANRRLRDIAGVDAVLITYPADAAYLETEHPVLVFHDATWVQLLDYYPGYERKTIAAETIRGGSELDKRALQRCDHAVYSSQWAADGVIRDYGIPPGKVSVVPLGANIVNEPTREDLALCLSRRGQGPMKLFFLGKEWYRKGGDIAVQVAAEIERLGIPVELHVAGCDPEGEVPPFVHPHGFLRKDVEKEAKEIRELFLSSDYFILPTRADATPVVLAEAAAFGLPVMTSDTGGLKDTVRGEWGAVLAVGCSPAQYAEWAVSRYRNRAEYERLSRLARQCFEQELNWPVICSRLAQKAADCALSKRSAGSSAK